MILRGTAVPKTNVEMNKMSKERANKCIECTVTNCAHHCCDDDYCSLDSIKIGTHECDPTEDRCTDCLSFKMK